MIKDDYKTFQQMLNFWVVQTNNNIEDEGLRVNSLTQITETNALEAEKEYSNPHFHAEYLEYSNFSICISFFKKGQYKGERVNYIVWENEKEREKEIKWWINIIYSYDQQSMRICYRNDIESNRDLQEFKDYLTQNGYDQEKTYSLEELSLNSDKPTEKVIDLFNYFEKTITDAKNFIAATNYKNDYSKVLLKSKNVIFHGAPGTGKTYLAKKIATDIVSNGETDDYCDLIGEKKIKLNLFNFIQVMITPILLKD